MLIDHCDFCDEFSEGTNNAFARIYGLALQSRILYRSKSFAVVPSMGPVVEGHLLIVPVTHYTAAADVPMQLLLELSAVCKRIRHVLSQAYGPTLFFEHGVRGTHSGGCGIDHAHVHAVPFIGDSEPIEEIKRSHPLKPIGGISEINQLVAPNSPYVYYEQTNGQSWACEVEFIPSQYLRRIVAGSLRMTSWDWRECGREQALITSFERLSAPFNNEPVSSEDSILSPRAKTALTV